MKQSFLLLMFSFLCFHAHAFINIESLRQNIEEGFNGSSGLALGGASGNTRVFNIGATSQNIYKDQQREYILIANYNYGEAQNVKNNNKGNFHVRYAQGFATGWFWEIFSQAEFNEFQDLTLRSLLGGGLRARLFQGQTNTLFLGAGAFYEDETIDQGVDQSNFRGNIYLSFRSLLTNQIESVLVAYYQPSFKVIDDYRIQATAGLETKITEQLQWVNTFSFATDTRPPAGIENEDFTYSVIFNFSY